MWKQTHAVKGFIYIRCCFCREDFLNRKFFVSLATMPLLSFRCKFILSLSKGTLRFPSSAILILFVFFDFHYYRSFSLLRSAGCGYYITTFLSADLAMTNILRSGFFFLYRSVRHCETDTGLLNFSRLLSRRKQSSSNELVGCVKLKLR